MSSSKTKKANRTLLFLRIGVVIGTLILGAAWLFKGENLGKLIETFDRIDLWAFAIAFGIFIFGQIIVGLRWWLLLRTQLIFIKFWAAVRLHYLGLFYNNFMPSSVGGDLIRAWYATKHTSKKHEAALSVFVDRAIGLLSTLIIACFFYFLFLRGRSAVKTVNTNEDKEGVLHLFYQYRWSVLGVVLIILAVPIVASFHKKGKAAIKKIRERIWYHIPRAITKFKDSFVLYCKNPSSILSVFCLTVFIQIACITGFWILGINMGIEASIKYYYVFFTLTWVVGAIPISIGGAGVVEGSLAVLFITLANVPQEQAVALALCQRVVWMLTSLPGAGIHLFGAHLPKDFSIDSNGVVN